MKTKRDKLETLTNGAVWCRDCEAYVGEDHGDDVWCVWHGVCHVDPCEFLGGTA